MGQTYIDLCKTIKLNDEDAEYIFRKMKFRDFDYNYQMNASEIREFLLNFKRILAERNNSKNTEEVSKDIEDSVTSENEKSEEEINSISENSNNENSEISVKDSKAANNVRKKQKKYFLKNKINIYNNNNNTYPESKSKKNTDTKQNSLSTRIKVKPIYELPVYDEDTDEKCEKILDNLCRYKLIFIDTCSLLYESSNLFWGRIVPYLQKNNKRIIVSKSVIQELVSHYSKKPDLKKSSEYALALINLLFKKHLIEIYGDLEDKKFADHVFYHIFAKYRMEKDLLLITQDIKLSKSLLIMNHLVAVEGRNIETWKINKFGYLSKIRLDISDIELLFSDLKNKDNRNNFDNSKKNNIINLISKEVTKSIRKPIEILFTPAINDTLIAKARGGEFEIILGEEIASGGEGIIFQTNTEYIAKVYNKNSLDTWKQEKIEYMLTLDIKRKGICYPVAALYNKNSQFVGYLMNRAYGRELSTGLFIKPLMKKYYPGWKKIDTVRICIDILEKIKYLHENNIILGDINPRNILINDRNDIYFVDVDSYQIQSYPCTVGTVNFTPPEIINIKYDKILRTFGNEYFSIATLLFMIMLPGKSPYSHQGGGNEKENILGMEFSYPLSEKSNKKTPDGPWKYCWSHLTYNLKESFYKTFSKGEEFSTEENRIDVDGWLNKFKEYEKLLNNGILGNNDLNSEEIFPDALKKVRNMNYETCTVCGKEFIEGTLRQGICRDCINQVIETHPCKRCGKDIEYTNYQKYISGKYYETCQDCSNRLKEVYETRNCPECGSSFNITVGEYESYSGKGLYLPKRCEHCRKNRY